MNTPTAPADAAQADILMTIAEWSQWMGWKSPGMAYQAQKEGRVVTAPDGQHLLARASRARYAATADPAKQGVAQRHAKARAADPAPATAATETDRIGNTYQAARAVKERFLALEAKRAYEVAIGQLRDAREVEHLAVTVGADLRQRLESLAISIAPMLLGQTDEAAVRALLQDQFADALASATHHFRRLAATEPTP